MKYYTMYAYQGCGESMFTAARVPEGPLWTNYETKFVLPLLKAEILEDENFSGTLTITVPIINYAYRYLEIGTVVEVCESSSLPVEGSGGDYKETCGNPIWVGRVIRISLNNMADKECVIEGPYTFLKDYIVYRGNDNFSETLTVPQIFTRMCNGEVRTQNTGIYGNPYNPFYGLIDVTPNTTRLDLWDQELANATTSNASSSSQEFWADGFFKKVNTIGGFYKYVYNRDTSNAYDAIKNMLDAFYASPVNNPDGDTYAISWTIYHDMRPRTHLCPVSNTVSFAVSRISKSGWTQGGSEETLRLTDYIKSINISSSLDNIFTCFSIIGKSDENGNVTPDIGLNNSTTSNGIVNAPDYYIKKYGVHTTIIKAQEVLGLKNDITSVETLNKYVPTIMKRLLGNAYEVDIVANDIPDDACTFYDSPSIGRYVPIDTPATRNIGINYFRCVSKRQDLLNPSKTEYHFANYMKTDYAYDINPVSVAGSKATQNFIKSLSERITKLEEENAKLKSILQKGD